MNEITPDEFINKFLKWFDLKSRIAFLATFLTAFFVHMPIFTTRITHGDNLWNNYPKDHFIWESQLGRWALSILGYLKNGLTLPRFNFILTILFVALTVVLIVKMFGIKSNINIIILGVLFASFPIFANVYTFFYCSAEYMLAMFLAVLAVYVCNKNMKMFWVSASLMVISLAIYQVYIQFTVSIFLILTIFELMKNEVPFKNTAIKLLKYFGICVLAGMLYILSLKLAGTELSDYKNLNNIGYLNLSLIPQSIVAMYLEFVEFLFSARNMKIAQHLHTLILLFVLACYGIIFNKSNEKKRVITIVLMTLLFPIAFFTFLLYTPKSSINFIMYPQMIIMIIYALLLSEKVDEKKYFALRWGIVISEVLLAVVYAFIVNAMYLQMQMHFDGMYALSSRIVYRIEQDEGYAKDMPIVICGDPYLIERGKLVETTSTTVANHMVKWSMLNIQENTRAWLHFIRYYFLLDWNLCKLDMAESVIQTEEFKNMGYFPEKDSVKIIDGVMVVKLTEQTKE